MKPCPLSPFSSERERRLWGWTVAVVFAIYSTLGLARSLAWLMPSRVFDVEDMVFNTLAVVMAISGATALRWARARVDGFRGRSPAKRDLPAEGSGCEEERL